MKTRTPALALTAALLTTITACGTGTDNKPKIPSATVTTEQPPVEVQTPEPEETATSDGIYELTEAAVYKDERKIQLSAFSRAVSSGTASPEKTAYARFTLTVTNDSTEHMDLARVYISCQYGAEGRESEEIFDSANGLNGMPSTHLLAGRKLSTTIGCELPKNETYLQIEVTPDLDSEVAIFTGNVQN